MIVSEDLKLLFVEVPNTGCTAIGKVLMEHYGGKPILHKHAIYYEFRRHNRNWRDYKIAGGVRNPLEVILTQYQKFVNNHAGRFNGDSKRQWWSTTQSHWNKFNDVQGGMSFEDYLVKYHRNEYHNFYLLGNQYFDVVVRNENLQQGFEEMMNIVGVKDVAAVPKFNATQSKSSIEDAYSVVAQEHSRRVFGPFMKKWNYSFPSEWNMSNSNKSVKFEMVEQTAEFVARLGFSPNGSGPMFHRLRSITKRFTG